MKKFLEIISPWLGLFRVNLEFSKQTMHWKVYKSFLIMNLIQSSYFESKHVEQKGFKKQVVISNYITGFQHIFTSGACLHLPPVRKSVGHRFCDHNSS